MRNAVVVIMLTALLGLSGRDVQAEEGGAGHYSPGAAATLIDLLPTEPGLVIQPLYLNYQADWGSSRDLPIAGTITARVDVASHAFVLGALYTFDRQVLGASWSAGLYAPYAWVDVTASIRSGSGLDGRRTDTADGFGDLTLVPVGLAWKRDDWQFSAMLPILAPTGSYEVGRLANPGLNYWTFDPTASVGFNSEERGFNAAIFAGMTVNTTNDDTQYKSGSVLHVEGSAQQLLPLGRGYFGLGANAFLYEQVTGDSGNGATLGDFKRRSVGIGPVIDYLLPFQSGETLAMELRWLPELDTKNAVEGDYLWLKLAYIF